MIETYTVGRNSVYLKIQGETNTSVLTKVANIVVKHGWTLVQSNPLEFKSNTLDGRTKNVRLLCLLDTDLQQTIGTLCSVVEGVEMTAPKRSGIFDRFNWFKITSSEVFELWIFVSPRWLFITSKEGDSLGRGITNGSQGVPGFYKSKWYSTQGYHKALNTNSGFTNGGDYMVPSASQKNYQYVTKKYELPTNLETVWRWGYTYALAAYYDEINDYVRKGVYDYYRSIQGVTEIEPYEKVAGQTPNYMWISTGLILDEDECRTDSLDSALTNKIVPYVRSVGGLKKPLDYVGELPIGRTTSGVTPNVAAQGQTISGYLKTLSDVRISASNGEYTVSGINIRDTSPIGKLIGLKIAQVALSLPFGSIVKLRTDDNYNLSKDGSFRDFVVVPSLVTRSSYELRRTFAAYEKLTELGWNQLPHLIHGYPIVDRKKEVIGDDRSNIFVYGTWDYQWEHNRQSLQGVFLIPA